MAVFSGIDWFYLRTDGRNCRQCDKVLHELENIDDETDHFGNFWMISATDGLFSIFFL